MDWVANVLVWGGLFLIGYKDRRAFLLLAAGDFIWVTYSLWNHLPSVAASYAVFFAFSVRNWWLWRNYK